MTLRAALRVAMALAGARPHASARIALPDVKLRAPESTSAIRRARSLHSRKGIVLATSRAAAMETIDKLV